jgi:hypothetical protein
MHDIGSEQDLPIFGDILKVEACGRGCNQANSAAEIDGMQGVEFGGLTGAEPDFLSVGGPG